MEFGEYYYSVLVLVAHTNLEHDSVYSRRKSRLRFYDRRFFFYLLRLTIFRRFNFKFYRPNDTCARVEIKLFDSVIATMYVFYILPQYHIQHYVKLIIIYIFQKWIRLTGRDHQVYG